MKYHILNGDALLDKFPKIEGEKVVLRECLIEGDKSGDTWDIFVKNRVAFLNKQYATTPQEYLDKSVAEFEKIKQISASDEVYFWFEDDLFCQVNFWFSCSLLSKSDFFKCFFVRAKSTEEYGFGGMNTADLQLAYQNTIRLQSSDIDVFTEFWNVYKTHEISKLVESKSKLSSSFSFVGNAIDAAVKLTTLDSQKLTVYECQIREMITQNESIFFVEVFQLFTKENSILGLGDLQVKRMYDKVKDYV